MFFIGREQAANPEFNWWFRVYFWVFGAPEIGAKLRAKQFLRALRSETFSKVLDTGCGKGYLSFHLASRYPKVAVVGVDSDRVKLEANRYIRDRHGLQNLKYLERDVTILDDVGLFDLALSVDNFEHIEDDSAAMRSIYRNLAPGGRLIVHVPRSTEKYFLRAARDYVVEGHVRAGYQEDDLTAKLRSAGFCVIRAWGSYTFFLTLANQMGIALSRWLPLYALALPLMYLIASIPESLAPKRLRCSNGVMAIAERPE